MMSGSREKESFWFFVGLLAKRKVKPDPFMGGINGFFGDGFPLLQRYVKVFHVLMDQYMPELHSHLEDLPDLLWINKWF